MATIASLLVNVMADTSDIRKSMKAAEDSVSGFAKSVSRTLTTALSVGAVVSFGKEILADADAMVKLSDKTGIAIEPLQRLKYIAEQSGNTFEQVTAAVSMMQKRISDGDKSAVGALNALGLSLGSFLNLSPDQQFKAIAAEVAKIEDPMQRAHVATALFGRSGTEVLPTLIADIEALGRAAPVMSEKATRGFDAVGDAMSRVWAQTKVLVGEGIEVMIDAYSRLSKILINLGSRGDHKALIDALFDLETQIPKVSGEVPKLAVANVGLALSEKEAADIGKELDASLKKQTTSVKAQAEAVKFAGDSIAHLIPEWRTFDGLLVSTIKPLEQGAEQFKFLGWAVEPLASKSLPTMIAELPKVTKGMQDAGDAAKFNLGDALKFASGLFDNLGRVAEMAGKKTLAAVIGIAKTTVEAFASGGPVRAAIAGVMAVFTAFGEKFFKIEEQKVNDLRDAFMVAQGGYEHLHQALIDANAESAFYQVWNAKNMKDWEAGVEAVNAALDGHAAKLEEIARLEGEIADIQGEIARLQESLIPTWDQVKGVLDKYNISLGDTGAAIQQLRANDWAKELLNDYELLSRAGMDTNAILAGMGDAFVNFVNDSLKYGTAIPENMKPVIQALIDQGKLFDATGAKITDIAQLKWGAPVETEADKINKAIKSLVESLDKLVASLDALINPSKNAADAVNEHWRRAPWQDWPQPEWPENPGGPGAPPPAASRAAAFASGGAFGGVSAGFAGGTLNSSSLESKLDQLLSELPRATALAVRDAVLVGS